MKVKEIMNKILVVEENFTLKEAAKLMSDKSIGCLVVSKKDKVLGIITERDIIKNISKLDKKIFDIMSKQVLSVDKNESVEHAAELMAEKKIKKLPVLDEGKLIGIITATDVIANVDDLNEEFYFD